MSALQYVINKMKHNSFNKEYYQVDFMMEDLIYSLARFMNRQRAKSMAKSAANHTEGYLDIISNSIPAFQRDNDKWTDTMQSLFVRNVLLGLKPPPLLLYSVDGTKSNCNMLDGLQRTTSLIRFLTDPDMRIPFGNNVTLSAKELLSDNTIKRILDNLAIPVRIYQFTSDKEACAYYIDINENITHSADDILRARQFLEAM